MECGVSMNISDQLQHGQIYKHKIDHTQYSFVHKDLNGFYHFLKIPKGTPFIFDALSINAYLEQFGTLTVTLPSLNPNKLYIVHKVCRVCGQAGSHNVVNHKEYYWCKSCRDEC